MKAVRLAALLALGACDRDSEPAAQPPPPSVSPASADAGSGPADDSAPPAAAAAPEPEPPDAVPAPPAPPDPWLAAVLDPLRPKFDKVLDDPAHYRFQILVTEVELVGDAPPKLTEHGWRVDAEYVYPASAIKTFASVGALRTLQRLRQEHGKRVDVDTPLALCRGRSTRCRSTEDETNIDAGVITLRQEIRKMQLVSNNTAFNRLVQFVGMDALNADMRGLGFASFRLHHPLWVGRASDDPVDGQVELRPARGKKVIVPAREQTAADMPPPPFADMMVGDAYLDDEQDKARVDEPMDFSPKNYVSIRDFHRLTMAIARPELPDVPQLGLDAKHIKLLRAVMHEDPLDSENPVYTDEKKGSLRYKTLLRGLSEVRDPARIRYLNKAGRAYGFHLENAWIRDRTSKRELFVTVVIYVNDDGLLNDDLYGYDAISRPLFVAMGESLGRVAFDAKR